MFFTPELLSKRDSGFGLLWLAATLGSRSAFRKLPKRSVLVADISKLCDLISQPAEPLALRLSSNLMFGVVRVYKVKQDLFLTDVTNCVSSLKKVVEDMRSIGAQEGQLQMANPTARPSTVTIIPNPQVACTLDYDALVVDWDEYLNIGDMSVPSISIVDADDDDFDPNQRKEKGSKIKSIDGPEVVRKETHTLEEHHEHILSASFDLSFNGSGHDAGLDPSSSQIGGHGFDSLFSDALEDGLGLELGDDLARELGWAISPIESTHGSKRNSDLNFENANQMNEGDLDFNFNDIQIEVDPTPINLEERTENVSLPDSLLKKIPKKENRMLLSAGSLNPPVLSPATSFSRQLLSQDNEALQPLRDITAEELNKINRAEPPKKLKRARVLLDARTELTDEELKVILRTLKKYLTVARAKYLPFQRLQKRELLQKKLEKENGRIIEEMIWGAPKGMQARELIHFWQVSFKVQVETRTGTVRLHEHVRQPKRRRVDPNLVNDQIIDNEEGQQDGNINMDMDWNFDNNQDVVMLAGDYRHSSEEPGQARRMSRPVSVTSVNLGLNLGDFGNVGGSGGSQRSLFPWDNAGPSSGSGDAAAPDIDHPIAHLDIKLRSESPTSRREGSLAPSQRTSIIGGLTFSPMIGKGGGSQILGEDFAFHVQDDGHQETQQSDMNLMTLERNSYHFLEYAKMQQRSLARPDDLLSFEVVAPKATSTRHVAAAAFYHCLVLATKKLIRLEQLAPYEPFLIAINQ